MSQLDRIEAKLDQLLALHDRQPAAAPVVSRDDRGNVAHLQGSQPFSGPAAPPVVAEAPRCMARRCFRPALTEFPDGAGRMFWLCEEHGDLLGFGDLELKSRHDHATRNPDTQEPA